MSTTRWNSERWTQTGTNEAGDPIYERGTKTAAPKKPAAKKTAAKKKS